MKFLKHFWGLALAAGLLYLLNQSWGTVPPLGKLFSPFQGFLQNTEQKDTGGDLEMPLKGLKGEVSVRYDDNAVPHIFAQNDDDLFFAQGYVIARDRLWQMEFYTMVSSGRLTEIVGERALEYDRYNRKSGMANSAKKIAENLKKDPLSSSILEAYSAGVNAYIAQLSYKDLPVEYKILNYKPEPWSSYKTILMLMNMRNTLSGGSNDYRLTNVVSKYGLDAVKDLFPDYPVEESPIIPVGTKWEFTPLQTPAVPEKIMALPDNGQVALNIHEPRPEIGSNNWAVGGAKSATGLPILANDPHLGLSLPSIWYQMQLSSPNMNVYGVALPGSPGIVIGFNKDVAWGVTNVGSDVLDFYKIKFKDKTMKEYWHDNQWKKTEQRIETFVLKGGKVISDTLYLTHHGPIIYTENKETDFNKNAPAGHAMRWITNETDGADLLTFYYLNKAKNYDDYRKALTYYTAPAQNFVFSSNQNDIAITPNGKFPLKWKNQGKYILDGTLPSHDWQGWIPKDQNPTVKNPPRGFVSSANQFSTDPTYPYYLGWRFAPSERGMRINERLEAMTQATADSLRSVQNDNFNLAARRILPALIASLKKDPRIAKYAGFSEIENWNLKNDAGEVGATIFERWREELNRAIWNDEFSPDNKMLYPSDDRTFEMIKKEPAARWFDNQDTKDKIETMDEIIGYSFKAAIDSLTKHNGSIDPKKWAWSKVKSTDIKHLVPAFQSFSRMDIDNGGGKSIVNATTATTGPSWRMIVELDKSWPRGYGLYPGGQSGNPGSIYYDNMIDKWAKGELNTLLFLKNKEEKSDKIKKQMVLKPQN